MPRTPSTESAEDQAIRQLIDEDEDAINGIAARSGPPPDTERASESEEDDLYAFEDRFVTNNLEDLSSQLMTTGLPPELTANMLILKVRKDWAPNYQQPTQDAALADQLIRAAQYPFRWGLFDDVMDPRERVTKAERLDRRYQKAHTARQEQMSRPITMPSGGQGAYGQPSPPNVEMSGLPAPAPEMGA